MFHRPKPEVKNTKKTEATTSRLLTSDWVIENKNKVREEKEKKLHEKEERKRVRDENRKLKEEKLKQRLALKENVPPLGLHARINARGINLSATNVKKNASGKKRGMNIKNNATGIKCSSNGNKK